MSVYFPQSLSTLDNMKYFNLCQSEGRKWLSPYFNTHFLNCECYVTLVTAGEKGESWGLLEKTPNMLGNPGKSVKPNLGCNSN